jgi:hypothetical protein
MADRATRAVRAESSSLLWASGLATFAGVLLVMTGFLQFLQGLSAVFRDPVYIATVSYIYKFDLTAWGWIHIIIGIVVIAVGVMIMTGRTVGYVAGIVIAGLSTLANFLFIPYYPLWSIVLIALNVAIIWALSVLMGQRPGR